MTTHFVHASWSGLGVHHLTGAAFLTPLFLLIAAEHTGFAALSGVPGLMLGCAAAAWLFALAHSSGAIRSDVLNALYVLLFITAFCVSIAHRDCSRSDLGGVLGAAWSLSALALGVCWLSVRQTYPPEHIAGRAAV